jgi:glycerol-1-phosphate dehydrogenase [NAD(P)+]
MIGAAAGGDDVTPARAPPDVLRQLLQGEWIDPDSRTAVRVPVRTVVIEPSLRGAEAALVAPLGLGRRLAVVSDATTRAVLGERVERALAGLGAVSPIVLEGRPHADADTAAKLRQACATTDALIAVGSGTINDLCKYVAAADGKPYAVFATAPSMNGYTSTNAAITVDGHKQSLAAAAPTGVFIELEVLARAPARMIRAGLGDSLCRSTAQADWLLSSRLLGTAYRRAPFALLADDEPALLDEPEALLAGDLEAMRALARTLVLSGLGMTLCGGSHPASQGEHLISHYIDMFAPSGRDAYFHGEQVAVATLTMARLQEEIIAAGPPRLRPGAVSCADLQGKLGAAAGAACWREFQPKRLSAAAAATLSQRIERVWDAFAGDVGAVTIPASRLAATLTRVGAPSAPADIGITPGFYASAVRNARFVRNRYTFLDLADDSGLLERMWPGG